MPQGSCATPQNPPKVALIVDEHSNPFEVGCACEIFGQRVRPEIGHNLYDLSIVTPGRSVTMRDGLFRVQADGRLADVEHADLVIVPNRPDVDIPSRPAVLAAVRRAHERGAHLVGLCTGAFTLAEAGVLEGRRAAVHWQLADEFRARFPNVQLEPDVLFIDDGDVLTSAGSAAALDLSLHIVRRDYGTEVANHVGRRLVFAAFRDGGQRQFVEQPLPAATESPLASVLNWALERLHLKLSVEDLAREGRMSVGTLHRRFRDEIGTTPLGWLTAQRVALACRLIEQGALTMDVVAHRSGIGSAAHLRSLFRKHLGVSPSDYRRRFAAVG
ncbi:AraC family transcriptional regulator [Kineosporia sp. NBRC 101677]|uniref:GlxA family transcriptional regulator n=1 Tax=Kineosporia sp. NBRC 101677 TaxID=3032197 RepID=UPI0024A4DBC6|nr:helix-turn-helix domain-containing protein [Kineosporia sp. NBRC 101677]GLY16909.1 AraC family transcriptional regulator [Kineosporia sp. NBRC 101677]